MTTLSGDEVHVHIRFDAHGDVPFGWNVVVVEPGEPWDRLMAEIEEETPEWLKTPVAYARTTMSHFPGEDGTIGTMYFRADFVYVGMVAHEALHLASWMCRFPESGVDNRRMTLGHEPERLAEITGTLTSVVWYNLEKWWCVDE